MQTSHNCERGRANPDKRKLQAICAWLKIHFFFFLMDINAMQKNLKYIYLF